MFIILLDNETSVDQQYKHDVYIFLSLILWLLWWTLNYHIDYNSKNIKRNISEMKALNFDKENDMRI